MTDSAVLDEVFDEVRLCRAHERKSIEPGWSERLHQALRVVDRLARRRSGSTWSHWDLGMRGRWRGASLQEDLSLALQRGEVTFLVRDLPAGSPSLPDQPRPPGSVRPPGSQVRTWIGVRFVDTNGRAVARHGVLIVDPGGARHPTTTGDRGEVRLDGIPPGVCDITLSGCDGRDWGPAGPSLAGDLRLDVPEHVRVAHQGECFSSLARDRGFRRLDAFLGHPDNAELLASRQNPNILAEGDRVTVPDRLLRVEDGATGREHEFTVAAVQVMLRLRLQVMDGDWDRWTLAVGGARQSSGALAPHGEAQDIVAAIDAEAASAVLQLGHGERSRDIPLALGTLDPWDSERGWRMRLRNLGYLETMIASPGAERRGVALFQRDHGLAIDGESGPKTRMALRDAHGC